MLEVIEKLLILQDCDRKRIRLQAELASIGPQRQMLQAKAAATQAKLDLVKHRAKQIETNRKKLELEVEAQKQLIEKYSLQQFQTKKNEEYRALTNEIDTCKAQIIQLEDQQLELMEQAESAQKDITALSQQTHEIQDEVKRQLSSLESREQELKKYLSELQAERAQLELNVDESARLRYERLLKSKGEKVIVGIERGVCGGCHMKLPVQAVISCQGDQEIINCPNCGRILYYTRDMDLTVSA